MNKDKDTLVPMSKNQMSPGLCDSRDFEVIEAGETRKISAPFHGQCGSTLAQYEKLLREGAEAANASDFDENAEQRPDVNSPGKPHTL